MCELGLIDVFLKLPHQKVETLTGQVGAEHLKMVDFRHVPTHCKFLALMPQWDFLNFVVQQGKRYKTFDLRMTAEAVDLVEEGGRIIGLHAKTPDGILTIRAALVVGCDGRHSTVREKAGIRAQMGPTILGERPERRPKFISIRWLTCSALACAIKKIASFSVIQDPTRFR
jgi:2-polyprenyl-6-methoxyphenol hydroxylase-like FAD-dependent oxidoreductase